MGLANGRAEGVFGGRDGNQMNVIGHQAISPNLHATSTAPLGHEPDVGPVIILAEKRLLTPVAPLGDVVRVAGGNDSC